MSDRLPPHSSESEQGVLGCILLDPVTSLPACIERLRSGAAVFYDIRNQVIYETLVELYEDQVPIDLISLQERLKTWGKLRDSGGMEYISTLPDKVPSAGNIEYYLEVVQDKHTIRRMIQTCIAVVQRMYEGQGDTDEMMDQVEREVLQISESRVMPKNLNIQTLVREAIDEIEAATQHNGTPQGLTTGFTDFDKMTDGLHPGEMVVVAARPGMGKAQPLDSLVLTPRGFVKMGNIVEGMEVIGSSGKPIRVLGVYPQGEKPIFNVILSDESRTQCCYDHLWFTQTRNERRSGMAGSVKSTSEILTTIRRGDGGQRNHVIPKISTVEFSSSQDLPIHPWLLGALIGDGKLNSGSVSFHKPEADLLEKVRTLLPEEDEGRPMRDGLRIIKRKKGRRNNLPSRTRQIIDTLGLRVYSEHKFIPQQYLMASQSARHNLLVGLLDTDGSVCSPGMMEYSTSSQQLAKDFLFVARSLGLIAKASKRQTFFSYKGKRKPGLPSWRIHIQNAPFSSVKHTLRSSKQTGHGFHRSIVRIVPAGIAQCQCIRVDSSDGIYVTDDFIPTHNSSLAMNVADHVACNSALPVGVISLEMTAKELVKRMICSRARVNARNLYNGFCQRDFPKLAVAAGKLHRAPLYIDDTAGQSILQIRAKARRWWQQYQIKLLIVDYLQLANAEGGKRRFENRQVEVSQISVGIKNLAKELGIPIIALCQLNRDIERDRARKPRLSDLRESGSLEADADLVGMLYKAKTDNDDDEESECEAINLLIAKSRNGPTGDVHLTFLKQFTKFESAAKVCSDDVPNQRELQPTTNDP